MALSKELLELSDIPDEDEAFFNPEHGYFGYEQVEDQFDVRAVSDNFGDAAYDTIVEYGAKVFFPDENNNLGEPPYLIEYADRVIELLVQDPDEPQNKAFYLNFAMKEAYQNKDLYTGNEYYYVKPSEYDAQGEKFVEFFREFTRNLDQAATLYISTEDPRIFSIYKRTFTDPETGLPTRERLHLELQDSNRFTIDSLSTVEN